MLEIINNTKFEKHTVHDSNNFLHTLSKLDIFNSIFDTSKQDLLKNKIKSNNLLKEKKYDYQNMIYSNFNLILNNILTNLNQKPIQLNIKEYKSFKAVNVKKKSIDKNYYNYSLLLNSFFKNIKIFNYIEKKQDHSNRILKLLKKNLSDKIKTEEHKYVRNCENNINQIKKVNHIKKINNLNYFKINNIKSFFEENMNFTNDYKNIVFPLDYKHHHSDLDTSKKENNIATIIHQKCESNMFCREEYNALNVQKIILNNTHNFIKWKNLINNKILLSILKKNNQAEINLTPESLGSINILINIKDNDITLKLISRNNIVRMLLNDCMPFLYNELKKKGMKLSKYNIFESFKDSVINKQNSNKNNNFYQSQKKINTYKQKISVVKNKTLDWYV